jgi:hypothetical protein
MKYEVLLCFFGMLLKIKKRTLMIKCSLFIFLK